MLCSSSLAVGTDVLLFQHAVADREKVVHRVASASGLGAGAIARLCLEDNVELLRDWERT